MLTLCCKKRGICPSCDSKRAAAFAAFLKEELLENVGHTLVTFTLPKMLRAYFMHHRELLSDLCFKRRADRAESLDLGAGLYQNVLGYAQPTKTAVGPLGTANRQLVAFTNDNEEVEVAALIGRAPGVRAKQPDLIEREFRRKATSDFL